MPRTPNPFHYQDPTQGIANSLVTAMLGDPAARAKQQQAQAEIDERAAHARLYNTQADGVGIRNDASTGLPAMLAALAPRPAPTVAPLAIDPVTQAPIVDDLAAAFDARVGPAAQGETPLDALRRGLPAVLASMGQMQGDKIDPRQIIGTLGAFAGDDEIARRALVAQGHSPSENFAIDAPRADAISARDAGEAQAQAWGVAERNHANDIPVANIRRSSAFDVAGVGARSRENVAGIAAGSRAEVAGIKAGGPVPGFDAIQKVFPGVRMNSGWRSKEHNRAVGGVENSWHLGRPSGQGYDIPVQPGMTVQEAGRRIEAANPGVKVMEAKQHDVGSGLHWHFALQNTGGARPAAAKPAKPINSATQKTLNDAVDGYLATQGIPADKAQPATKAYLYENAASLYAQAGSAPAAARMAWEKMQRDAKTTRDRRQAATTGASAGRRLSPAEAQRLPPGTKFIAQDGRELVRAGPGGWGKARVVD